jgi:polynucleotide 5'-hydroxyl-kinase GRC3/NOL9
VTQPPSDGGGDAYRDWEATLAAIVEADGPAMVIGGTDVGKTTFTRLLVNRAVAAGRRVAVLDADPGQSEIGPPACAGLAFVDEPVTLLSDLVPNALAFVGSVSPAARLLEHITAVRRLADMAAGRFLVIDTSGYLHGGARRLIQSEFDLVAPSDVVALQRGDELHGFLAPLRRRAGCRIHTPLVPAAIGAKPPSLRTQRRAMRFSAYLRDAKSAHYAFNDVAFTGTWLGSGTPVPAHILRFLNDTLRPHARIYHAETSGRHLGLMTDRPLTSHSPEMGIAMEQLRARDVSVTVAPRLKHLLVGLEASNGKLLGLGLLVSLDFRRGVAGVLTPVRSPDAACILHFGIQRISPDGSDAGALKPDEL